jgi:CpcD/allophycocyanin linker domain
MYGIETTGTASSSDYNSRIALVEVVGASRKQARNSNYTLRVSLGRLSQTIQRIAKTGGKIVNIVMPSFDAAKSDTNQVPTLEAVENPVPLEVVVSPLEEIPTHSEVVAVQAMEIEAEKPEAEKSGAKNLETTRSEAKEKSSQSLAKKLTDKLPKTSKRTKKARS